MFFFSFFSSPAVNGEEMDGQLLTEDRIQRRVSKLDQVEDTVRFVHSTLVSVANVAEGRKGK